MIRLNRGVRLPVWSHNLSTSQLTFPFPDTVNSGITEEKYHIQNLRVRRLSIDTVRPNNCQEHKKTSYLHLYLA